jgi:hypothetical protein
MSYPYSSLYLEGQWSRLKLAKLFHPGTDALCGGPTQWRIDHPLAADRHRDCRQPGKATPRTCAKTLLTHREAPRFSALKLSQHLEEAGPLLRDKRRWWKPKVTERSRNLHPERNND